MTANGHTVCKVWIGVSGCDQTKLKPTKVFKIEAMHKILYYLGWLWIVSNLVALTGIHFLLHFIFN